MLNTKENLNCERIQRTIHWCPLSNFSIAKKIDNEAIYIITRIRYTVRWLSFLVFFPVVHKGACCPLFGDNIYYFYLQNIIDPKTTFNAQDK
jgi:hypothetical protein